MSELGASLVERLRTLQVEKLVTHKLCTEVADHISDLEAIVASDRELKLSWLADIAELEAIVAKALDHVLELEEAWRSGAVSDCDGQGGTRSNRNSELRAGLAKALGYGSYAAALAAQDGGGR